MFDLGKYRGWAVLAVIGLLISACSTSAGQESSIATAVAQTVQAGESLTQISSQPTLTPPAPQATLPSGTPLPAASATGAPTLSSAPADPDCARAVLVSENPPDNTLVKPGQYFWKTWRLKNTGTCTWNPSYSLVFWDGDLMGGLSSYPLDDEVAPGEEKDISIYLQAPATEGTFTGYWRLKSPWNANFGVGPDDSSFYVQVEVSNSAEPDFGISSVTAELVRDPATGCPTNVRYTVYYTITTNGPFTFDYFLNQSDGNESGVRTMEFTEAGTKTISREWMIGKGDSPNPRWMEFVVVDPYRQEYGKTTILNNCP